ncbi:67 kDa myosin-cross-reactive antigen family protein [Tothia fuscella]|uniref:67 kDa myosin-cross-reactive antigen family protein n=1 Tax=Tothia fuscella TaxID=1048955 RepID=A0A9P4TSI6_9PEZI|nr:67 kDa myosin-cross-reactive antigen family protein [Tothia fuscella]
MSAFWLRTAVPSSLILRNLLSPEHFNTMQPAIQPPILAQLPPATAMTAAQDLSSVMPSPPQSPIDRKINGQSRGLGGTGRRDPKETHAYLIGGGIASLAAAVHLIQDAEVPANQVHIFESLPLLGGAMDGACDPTEGYILRGGRMLNFSYLCLYDQLDHIPSLARPETTVTKEIRDFNLQKAHKTHANARLIANTGNGPEPVDVSRMGLNFEGRKELIRMSIEGEKSLGTKATQDCFPKSFFESNFWYMWATILGDAGVDFRQNAKVTDLKMIEGIPCTVDEIHMVQDGTPMVANLDPNDIVFATIGSMTGDASVGTNMKSTTPVSSKDLRDGSWELWTKLAAKDEPIFGNPQNFLSRVPQSQWESFTVTLEDPEFFDRIVKFTNNKPGTGALVTFKDSNWLMSIVVPCQPHFIGQQEDVQVFCGYGLFPSQIGDFVQKPMTECNGHEVLTELLGHLGFVPDQILENSITRPCLMPYITSQFLTRKFADRPKVIPEGSTNLALLGQFVEIPEDTVFTVEYSVRGAQMAVFELMGLDKKPKTIYKGEHHVDVLAKALQKLLT